MAKQYPVQKSYFTSLQIVNSLVLPQASSSYLALRESSSSRTHGSRGKRGRVVGVRVAGAGWKPEGVAEYGGVAPLGRVRAEGHESPGSHRPDHTVGLNSKGWDHLRVAEQRLPKAARRPAGPQPGLSKGQWVRQAGGAAGGALPSEDGTRQKGRLVRTGPGCAGQQLSHTGCGCGRREWRVPGRLRPWRAGGCGGSLASGC